MDESNNLKKLVKAQNGELSHSMEQSSYKISFLEIRRPFSPLKIVDIQLHLRQLKENQAS